MKIALWIIAVVETIRMVEQSIQLRLIAKDSGARDNVYAEFVKSLKKDDKEFVRDLLEEFDRQTDVEVTRNALRTDCNGCKFVGWYDTEFPCVNCVRKNKDYYTAEQTEREGE